ncbi:M56 family metallopeptidase [Winogradskyella undariae]|uniref:M56 family metallopeptidase n=1 Tax=Winogradskyella undariae TaxID=1285465 RepID=UPI0015CA0DBA|nr:M56 family metallopeptidase [Winogradskyella undariae]
MLKNKISPFSFFKWIVYNPKSYKKEELQLILTHEKVHATQLHSIDILLTQLACVVFWINPLIWLYRKEIRQNLEYIADSNTQISTNTKKEYQHLLLKTSIANHDTLLSNNFYNSSIKKRIFMLNKTRSKQKNQLKYLLMLPLLAGLLISMNSKKIYLEAELLNNIEPINTKDSITHESIKLKFTNQMNDDRLEEFKTLLESKGVTMKIKSLKRNQDDKISSINIVFESKNRTTNYSSKIKEGILPFYFEMTDESIEVYNIKDIEYNENTLVAAYNIQKPNDTLYFKTIDSAKVQSLSKEKSDLYYEGGKTLKITTKNDDLIINQPQKKYKAISTATNNNQKPLIIIDGKEADYELLKYLNPNLIESMTVLKDNKAIDAYGDKGKNGVIILITKENTTEKNTTKTKNNNPWKAIGKSEINSLTYIDDENPSKNESIAYISKSSTDQILDSHINELKRIGITVKYSKLKRNKVGEITSIKISLEDNEGSKSSATWKVTNGIPDIEFGKSEGSLIARTK